MIYGVLVTYNDYPLIETAVKSIYDKVDRIVAVDGRFSEFPQINGCDFSTDGTLEFLRSLGRANVILTANHSEVYQRNQYLIGDNGDWYLHLDADEEWVGPLPELTGDAFVMKLKRETPYHEIDRVRLFRHMPGIHYDKKHYWLHVGEKPFALVGKVSNDFQWSRIKAAHIQHHELDRSQERIQLKKEYYKALRKRETKIREFL